MHLPVFNKIALLALANRPNQAQNQSAPSLALRLYPPKQVFLGFPEDSRSQNGSFLQLQALCADSFLMDKLNPLGERGLSYRCPKPNSKSPPGIGLRGSQGKWRWGGRAGREPEDRKWASALRLVSRRDSFQPDGMGCIQLPPWWGFNVCFLSKAAAGKDSHTKMKTGLRIPLWL